MSALYDEIYLETDEEVTSVIEKIKKSKKKAVVLSLPRNAVLGQSIVNLKLVYKQALAEDKEVGIVTPDKITHSLAERIGFQVFDSLKEVAFSGPSEKPEPAKKEPEPRTTPTPPKSEVKTPPDLATAGFTSQPLRATEKETDDSASDDMPQATIEEDLPPVSESRESARSSASLGGSMIPTRGNVRYLYKKKRALGLIPLIVGLVVLLAAGGAAALFIPRATVAVTVQAQPFEESVNTVVDTDATALDSDKATIPGKIVSVDQETKSSTKATGKKNLGQKATGTVTLYNEWDDKPRSFEAGTKLQGGGVQFVLTESATLPGATSSISAGKPTIIAGKVTVSVEAAAAGEDGNVAPTTFKILSSQLSKAQQDKIYGQSAAAFTGGTSNIVTVVTQADIDTTNEKVKQQNRDDALVQLKQQAGTLIVLDKAIQAVSVETTPSVAADTQADNVEVVAKGKYQVIAFSPDDQKQLLEKLLANKIPAGQTLVTSGDGVSLDTSQFDLNLVTEKRLELTNNLKAFTVTGFDQTAIRRQLTGAKKSDVVSIVDKSIATTKGEAQISPAWWPRLPFLSGKINLAITYVGKEAAKPTE